MIFVAFMQGGVNMRPLGLGSLGVPRKKSLCIFGAVLLWAAAGSLAAQWARAASPNMGKAEMTLAGGAQGPVFFPHQRHQSTLTDCMICHSLFPQQAGAIESLKADGKLKAKQVMNLQCTKCHNQKKSAGEKTGPTTCTTCHQKAD
jgi:hypothetical protein